MIQTLFLESCTFLTPRPIPAAMRKLIPPSIGTQGGGQHPGLVVAPPGGFGGPAANRQLVNEGVVIRVRMNTIIAIFFMVQILIEQI